MCQGDADRLIVLTDQRSELRSCNTYQGSNKTTALFINIIRTFRLTFFKPGFKF